MRWWRWSVSAASRRAGTFPSSTCGHTCAGCATVGSPINGLTGIQRKRCGTRASAGRRGIGLGSLILLAVLPGQVLADPMGVVDDLVPVNQHRDVLHAGQLDDLRPVGAPVGHALGAV